MKINDTCFWLNRQYYERFIGGVFVLIKVIDCYSYTTEHQHYALPLDPIWTYKQQKNKEIQKWFHVKYAMKLFIHS